jgi:hypothetical protein
MKKALKLAQDTRPQEQPEGSYTFGKNGIQNFLQGAVLNEPGFQVSSANIPFTPMGIIETSKFPIIFSTNNVYSAFGYFDSVKDVYTPIVNDTLLPFKLGFSTDHPIIGQSQRNYKGEVVVAFSDEVQKPFYVNCDNPNTSSLAAMMLFPLATPPVLDVSVQTGGSLLPGAYFAAVKYLRNDGCETAYLVTSSPAIVQGTVGKITDQGVQINISMIDPDYQMVQVAIISKVAGVTKAVSLSPTARATNLSILYTGAEMTEDITLEEILIQPAVYDKVGTIGQLNDALYLGDLTSTPSMKMQKYANLVRLKWVSDLITVLPPNKDMASGVKKTFMHQEVYACYIRYKLNSGITTQAFHIPGADLTAPQRAASTVAAAEGLTAKVFQVEDTVGRFDLGNKTGYMGTWENATEVYPDTADFDSTLIGGQNLRGQKVRHHRFPSISWCKTNLYPGNSNYGRTELDRLGIMAENVIIPPEYAGLIVGYEILYAKRTPGNSTVIGQSLYLFGGKGPDDTAVNSYVSSGGNFESEIEFRTLPMKTILQEQSIFHFHSFDMLFNKPSVTPDFLSFQLKHKRVDLANTDGYVEDGKVNTDHDGPMVYLIDYLQKGLAPTVPSVKLKAVSKTEYVPNNTRIGKWVNKGIESFFGGRLTNPETLIPGGEVSRQTLGIAGREEDYNERWRAVQQESTFLSNLMAIKANLFTSFTGQTLVRAGTVNNLVPLTPLYGGDTFICDYTFHTYGDWVADENFMDTTDNIMYRGTKVARRFLCESAANLYARTEVAGNNYSRYYPVSPLAVNDKSNYLTAFMRDQDPNQFGYSKDLNALDEFVSSKIFNTYEEDLTSHPYRIHRGGKLKFQTKTRSWQTFLPLDYYEGLKTMGKMMHLEGMDDHLLIHYENALLLTQDKTKLESDILSITLGSGDIFQFQPQEALSAKLGYAGTKHKLACVRTPVGYVFIDEPQKELFIYKGNLELINGAMNTFFVQFLDMKQTNPYIGNGFTIGYDPLYDRILLTAKNIKLKATNTTPTMYTPALLPSLTVGDIVYKNGRLQRYLGINTSGTYGCRERLTPVSNDITITIPENTLTNTVLTTATGTNTDGFFITGVQSQFSLNATTGELKLASPLNYALEPSYTLNCKSVNTTFGTEDTFVISINVTAVAKLPTLISAEVTLPERSAVNTPVHTLVQTHTGAASYSIVDGNIGSAFKVDSTGHIAVNSSATLLFATNPVYYLTLRITDTVSSADATIKVQLLRVPIPPTHANVDVTILNTTPLNTALVDLDPRGSDTYRLYRYALTGSTAPGNFSLSTDSKVLLTTAAVAGTISVLTVKLTDVYGATATFTVTITVKYDEQFLAFEPADGTCIASSPTCAPGYTLSTDGTLCTKVTSVAADAVGGGSPIPLAHYSYSQYSLWGTIIYRFGEYNTNGVPTVKANSTLVHSSAPIYGYKPSGEATVSNNLWTNLTSGSAQDGTTGRLNRTGVWKQSDVNYTGNLGFSRQFIVPSAGTYLVGVGSDDAATIKINGVTIVSQSLSAINSAFNSVYSAGVAGTSDLFRYWHVYEIHLAAGPNIISLTGNNTGSIGVIGCEVYTATIAQLIACTNETDLAPYILFSSAAPSFGVIADGDASDIGSWDCSSHPGYTLVYDPVAHTYSCRLVESAAPTMAVTTRQWANVKVKNLISSLYIASFANTAGHTFDGITVPTYAPVTNHVDCGGTVTMYLSNPSVVTRTKNSCGAGFVGSVVRYAKPGGVFTSLTSQAAADALAASDAAANAQAFANANGTCT